MRTCTIGQVVRVLLLTVILAASIAACSSPPTSSKATAARAGATHRRPVSTANQQTPATMAHPTPKRNRRYARTRSASCTLSPFGVDAYRRDDDLELSSGRHDDDHHRRALRPTRSASHQLVAAEPGHYPRLPHCDLRPIVSGLVSP
jgi:hypothetical protein